MIRLWDCTLSVFELVVAMSNVLAVLDDNFMSWWRSTLCCSGICSEWTIAFVDNNTTTKVRKGSILCNGALQEWLMSDRSVVTGFPTVMSIAVCPMQKVSSTRRFSDAFLLPTSCREAIACCWRRWHSLGKWETSRYHDFAYCVACHLATFSHFSRHDVSSLNCQTVSRKFLFSAFAWTVHCDEDVALIVLK